MPPPSRLLPRPPPARRQPLNGCLRLADEPLRRAKLLVLQRTDWAAPARERLR